MIFGFTKDRQHYTFTSGELDADGKKVWTVLPVPKWWSRFGNPVRYKGDYGLLGSRFYPLSVLHNMKV